MYELSRNLGVQDIDATYLKIQVYISKFVLDKATED